MKPKPTALKYLPYIAAVVVYTLVVSLIENSYTVLVINMAMLNAITAYGLSILLGMGGQLVFSGITFMGIGAYVTANMRSGRLDGFYLDSTLTILLSILVAAVIALVTGALFLRLKSSFCTFATLGFVQVMWSVYQNYEPAFGGPKGIPNVESIDVFGVRVMDYKQWFYIILLAVLLVAVIVERIRRSRLGRSLASIRDNEIAAQTLGVNIYQTRVIAFVIAGAFAGLSGSLLAMQTRFVSGDLFSFQKSSTIVVMSMLGGINNTVGIFIGSLIVTFLPELLRGMDKYLMIIYGIAVILMMIFMPMGISGLVTDFVRNRRRRRRIVAQTACPGKEADNGTDSTA